MPAPSKILGLVEIFRDNADAYHSNHYNEENVRNEFINPLFKCIDWDVTNEGGNAEAHKDELGFEPPIIKVQVMSSEGHIGDPVVSALYGKVSAQEHGLLVTLGNFTSQAVNFARSKSNLRLIDGAKLVALILAHYEELDSRYNGILPLKGVYVPESLGDQADE